MKRIAAIFLAALLASLPACHSPGPLPPPNYQHIDANQPATAWHPPSGVGPQKFGASLLYPAGVTARSVDQVARDSYLLRGEGLFSQTMPRQSIVAGSLMTDGTICFVGLPLLAGDRVSSIAIMVTVAGVAITLSKVGLYSAAGVLLAISADQGAAWQSTGIKSVAMITPYVATASGEYYVAAVAKGGTLPTLARGIPLGGSVPNTVADAVNGGNVPFGIMAGQVDLPANATIVTGTAVVFWGGVF